MLNKLKTFELDDQAVSPVVGVILMVAITVILAAVIGTFVLDLGGQVKQNAQAGVSFDESPTGQIDTTDDGTNNPDTETYEVTVQLNSIQNADSLTITASDNDNTQIENEGGNADPTTESDATDNGGSDLEDYDPVVGTSSVSSVGATSTVTQLTTGDTVTVVGTLDGNENVIQKYEVEG